LRLSLTAGVPHEVQPLSDVRRADARSAHICRPDGVTRTFQVSRNNVEPSEAVLICNLFAKDCCRSALADEPIKFRPKMTSVVGAASFAGG
jgi:hypothetical protein